jgi:transcriptional regulator with XRE-family HTH domain
MSMLRNLRERKGLTVSQLAAKASISSRVILDYEDGQSIPLAHAKLLAKALYVSIEELMPPAGSAPPQPVAASQVPRPAPSHSPVPQPAPAPANGGLGRRPTSRPETRAERGGAAQVRPTSHRPPNQRRQSGRAVRLARARRGRSQDYQAVPARASASGTDHGRATGRAAAPCDQARDYPRAA